MACCAARARACRVRELCANWSSARTGRASPTQECACRISLPARGCLLTSVEGGSTTNGPGWPVGLIPVLRASLLLVLTESARSFRSGALPTPFWHAGSMLFVSRVELRGCFLSLHPADPQRPTESLISTTPQNDSPPRRLPAHAGRRSRTRAGNPPAGRAENGGGHNGPPAVTVRI